MVKGKTLKARETSKLKSTAFEKFVADLLKDTYAQCSEKIKNELLYGIRATDAELREYFDYIEKVSKTKLWQLIKD